MKNLGGWVPMKSDPRSLSRANQDARNVEICKKFAHQRKFEPIFSTKTVLNSLSPYYYLEFTQPY